MPAAVLTPEDTIAIRDEIGKDKLIESIVACCAFVVLKNAPLLAHAAEKNRGLPA